MRFMLVSMGQIKVRFQRIKYKKRMDYDLKGDIDSF